MTWVVVMIPMGPIYVQFDEQGGGGPSATTTQHGRTPLFLPNMNKRGYEHECMRINKQNATKLYKNAMGIVRSRRRRLSWLRTGYRPDRQVNTIEYLYLGK